MQKITVYLERDPAAKVPAYQSPHSAGVDVSLLEDLTLFPGERAVCPTGLKMAIPEGYEIQVRPRSGLSLKTSLRISNSPGTIDADYRDEIGIIVENTYAATDIVNDILRDPDHIDALKDYEPTTLGAVLAKRGKDVPPLLGDVPVYVNAQGEPRHLEVQAGRAHRPARIDGDSSGGIRRGGGREKIGHDRGAVSLDRDDLVGKPAIKSKRVALRNIRDPASSPWRSGRFPRRK